MSEKINVHVLAIDDESMRRGLSRALSRWYGFGIFSFTNDNTIFRFIEKQGYAFNYHHNEPTTWGLGNPERNRFRFHQRRILAIDLAGTRVG